MPWLCRIPSCLGQRLCRPGAGVWQTAKRLPDIFHMVSCPRPAWGLFATFLPPRVFACPFFDPASVFPVGNISRPRAVFWLLNSEFSLLNPRSQDSVLKAYCLSMSPVQEIRTANVSLAHSASVLLAGLLWLGQGTVAELPVLAQGRAPIAGAPFDLQGFLDQEIKAGTKRIVVPPGRYRVSPRDRQHLLLRGLKDIQIIADGVEMICTETTRAITLTHCTNVTVRGLTIDYD